MKNSYKKYLTCCTLCVLLTACSDHKNNTDNINKPTPSNINKPTPSNINTSAYNHLLKGQVDIGEYAHATVCLDENNNLICDAEQESLVLVKPDGSYELPVEKSNIEKFKVIAEVGNYPSKKTALKVSSISYLLTAPIGKHAFISPLSTVIDVNSAITSLPIVAMQASMNQIMLINDNADIFMNYLQDYSDANLTEQSRLLKQIALEMASLSTAMVEGFRAEMPELTSKEMLFLVNGGMYESFYEIFTLATMRLTNQTISDWLSELIKELSLPFSTGKSAADYRVRLDDTYLVDWAPLNEERLKKIMGEGLWEVLEPNSEKASVLQKVVIAKDKLGEDTLVKYEFTGQIIGDGARDWSNKRTDNDHINYYLTDNGWKFVDGENAKFKFSDSGLIIENTKHFGDGLILKEIPLAGKKISHYLDVYDNYMDPIIGPDTVFSENSFAYAALHKYAENKGYYFLRSTYPTYNLNNPTERRDKLACLATIVDAVGDKDNCPLFTTSANQENRATSGFVEKLDDLFLTDAEGSDAGFTIASGYMPWFAELIRLHPSTHTPGMGKIVFILDEQEYTSTWAYEEKSLGIKLLTIELPEKMRAKFREAYSYYTRTPSKVFFTEIGGLVQTGLYIEKNSYYFINAGLGADYRAVGVMYDSNAIQDVMNFLDSVAVAPVAN